MVHNVHERLFQVKIERVGELLESLGSSHDRLWPRDCWPAMRLDRALQVGATGGHGPIRYVVQRHERGRAVWFRFTAPVGFEGGHGFDVEPTAGGVRLRHVLTMVPRGGAYVSWPLVFRPLHDALIEDALDRVARAVGESVPQRAWSPRVRLLRAMLRRRTRSPRAV
jgi:hypothetical protein